MKKKKMWKRAKEGREKGKGKIQNRKEKVKKRREIERMEKRKQK
jgi:hypothetical protein